MQLLLAHLFSTQKRLSTMILTHSTFSWLSFKWAGGSLSSPFPPTPVVHLKSGGIPLRVFVVILLALVGGAIVRSSIATRLGGFTIDEAYPIAAGVSYV